MEDLQTTLMIILKMTMNRILNVAATVIFRMHVLILAVPLNQESGIILIFFRQDESVKASEMKGFYT